MSTSQPMKTLVRVGHKPHSINRKKYGPPRLALFWANRHDFVQPGLWLWTGRKQHRILPIPKKQYR